MDSIRGTESMRKTSGSPEGLYKWSTRSWQLINHDRYGGIIGLCHRAEPRSRRGVPVIRIGSLDM
eukprot:752037-Hanusia_phi.AAC.1